MREIKGDLWRYYAAGVPCCITVNGFVKANGCAVMGRGSVYSYCVPICFLFQLKEIGLPALVIVVM